LKPVGYFGLPGELHYLLLDIEKRLIVHHARGVGVTILIRIAREGASALELRGLEFAMADILTA
jgi:hypothetical protein